MVRKIGPLVLVIAVLTGGCVEQEPAAPTEQDWKAIRQNLLKTLPKPKYRINADLEGNVVYLGLDVDPLPVKPGRTITLTHYWKVNKAVPGWRIFVHLGDPGNKRFINADHKPIGGRYPASMWKAGDIVRDEHKVTIPADWPAATVDVFVGLWRGQLRMKPTTGPHDDQNRIKAASLPVQGAATKAAVKQPLKRILAVQATSPVKIDGRLDDAVWSRAVSSGRFVNTLTGAFSPVQTEAKVAWDDKFLYVAFDNRDEDVWSSFTQRDEKLWTQEAVEVFIDANADGKDYVELQVNPRGAIFDSYLPAYRKNDNAWNSKLQAAVHVDGTVNKRDDKDQGWTVEMAIPWADTIGKGTHALKLPPAVGNVWRVNFFRLDMPRGQRQLATGWSPPLVGDFHQLGRFGELIFADAQGKLPNAVAAPASQPPAAGRVVPTLPNRLRARQASKPRVPLRAMQTN